MLDMLKQTGRPEMVVGWYHSHPGFGCWLSGVDINTQQSFEALSERAVAVVIDPIQSVKGKVVIDAFRLINPNLMVINLIISLKSSFELIIFHFVGLGPRTTSNNVEFGTLAKALGAGANPRLEPTLLFHQYQLSQKRA